MLAVVVFAAGAVTIALTHTGTSATSGSGSRGSAGSAGSATSGTGALAAAAVRRQAAAWVSHQVSSDSVVACDPAMCTALQAAGVASGQLLVLRPGQGDPLGSDIVVATAAVRSQFGTRLESVYAPVVIAGFGSGAARIEVRVVAPDGAAAYLPQFAADVKARKTAGAAVLHNTSIRVAPPARGQLASGQVDSRLLLTLVTMAHIYPVDIVSFGRPAPGASPGVPVRYAEIAGGARRHGQRPASLQALRSFLSVQRPLYRPSAVTTVRTASGRTVLGVEYPAPSPLGLFGSRS
jgi:hypothetical protein